MIHSPKEIPTIIVHITSGCLLELHQEILWGIEEEGIPYLQKENEFSDVVQEAYSCSTHSLLDVGVAFDGVTLVVHHAKLPLNSPMFNQKIDHKNQIRILGKNAARFVKGIPFIINEVKND